MGNYQIDLCAAAQGIARNKGEPFTSPLTAVRKLFLQETRDWTTPNAPRTGWKRGELLEVLHSFVTGDDWREEWGDVGYYLAQSYNWLWVWYAKVTPVRIIERAIIKFEKRSNSSNDFFTR